MKTQLTILAFLSLSLIAACDKLSDFEKQVIGTWESVSYVADTTDLSSDHHAKLILEKNGGYTFYYPYQEGSFSYLYLYEISGKWQGSETGTTILLEGLTGGWTEVSTVLDSDANIRMTGMFKDRQVSIVFVKQ